MKTIHKILKIINQKNKTKKIYRKNHTKNPVKVSYIGGKKYSKAVAILAHNKYNITGRIDFTETKKGLNILYDIKGLKNGEHGFHIHNYGDLSDGCKSACSHFNPYNKTHGGLDSEVRHLGDLGNIISKNNICKGKLFAKDICIYRNLKTSVLGRMIIIHKNRDDLGLGNNNESLKTGNAGERVACGVIGLANAQS